MTTCYFLLNEKLVHGDRACAPNSCMSSRVGIDLGGYRQHRRCSVGIHFHLLRHFLGSHSQHPSEHDCCFISTKVLHNHMITVGWWRNGSAFDSRSKGCEFDSRPPQILFALVVVGVVAMFGCSGAFSSLFGVFFAACARLVSVFWVVVVCGCLCGCVWCGLGFFFFSNLW